MENPISKSWIVRFGGALAIFLVGFVGAIAVGIRSVQNGDYGTLWVLLCAMAGTACLFNILDYCKEKRICDAATSPTMYASVYVGGIVSISVIALNCVPREIASSMKIMPLVWIVLAGANLIYDGLKTVRGKGQSTDKT